MCHKILNEQVHLTFILISFLGVLSKCIFILNIRPLTVEVLNFKICHSIESSTWLTTIIIYLGSRFVPHSKSFSICPLPKRIQKPERRVGKALTATEMIQTAKIWNFFEVSFFEYGWTAPVYRFNWLPKMHRMCFYWFLWFSKKLLNILTLRYFVLNRSSKGLSGP